MSMADTYLAVGIVCMLLLAAQMVQRELTHRAVVRRLDRLLERLAAIDALDD